MLACFTAGMAWSVYSIKDYNCRLRLDICMIAIHATGICLSALVVVLRCLIPSKRLENVMFVVFVMLMMAITVEVVAGFVLTVIVQFNRPACCHSLAAMIVNWTITGIGTLITTIVTITMASYIVMTVRKRRRIKLERYEIDHLYQIIYEPIKKVEHLVERYKDSLLNSPLSDVEIAILKDKFVKKYKKDQSQLSEEMQESCIICFLAFNMKDDAFSYPLCGHQYHWVCFEHWLANNLNCPMCKQPIRLCMIDAIRHHKSKTTKYQYTRDE